MEFTTKNGKGITYVRDTYGRFRIKFVGGGELPEELTGQFTYPKDAVVAIQRYLADQKGTPNGKRIQRKAD